MARHARHGRKGGKHIGSKRLERMVEGEYEKRGYSMKRSKYIGGAVVGKVYREQKSKRRRAF